MQKNKFLKPLQVAVAILFLVGCGIGKFTAISSDSSESFADPLFKYAWHLENVGQKIFATNAATAGFDLNLTNTWKQQIYGKNIQIQVSDDGLEDVHEDLHANFSYSNRSKNYTLAAPYTAQTSPPIDDEDNHGTCVAGLIAATKLNGVGARGVAPLATLTVANFLSDAVTITNAMKIDQASGSFDISNMSWGTTQDAVYTLGVTYPAQLKSMVTTGRSGKGSIFVKAAGNDFAVLCNGSTTNYCIGNSNFDTDNALPYVISVAALNATGTSSSYSSTGSNLWISSFGGEFGDDDPAMLTTDRMGCSKGRSVSSSTGAFENGTSAENKNCNYTADFNGTSSASPILAGAIAMILEANPSLTWRQVKYILAKTATADFFETGVIAHPQSGSGVTLPASYDWEQKWITNGAGFKFHNWYGFGRVNVDGAVALAQSALTTPINLGTYTETNWADANTGLSALIPDNSATGVTNAIVVATNLKIEGVQIRVGITHADISQLALELTSPSGVKSIVINARNSLSGIANFAEETFLTNAFYQESSAGTWTLKVVDAKAGTTGTLTSFKINFIGGVP